MLSALFAAFLLVSSPFSGLYKLELSEEMGGKTFIQVAEDGSVQMFDKNWYPFDMQRSSLEGNQIRIELFPVERPLMMVFTGTFQGEQLSGALDIPHPQFPIHQPFEARREVYGEVLTPLAIADEYRKDHEIDLVKYLVENAPRDSVDHFREFWSSTMERNFYPLLEPILPDWKGEQAKGERQQFLAELFASLPAMETRLKDEASAPLPADSEITRVRIPCTSACRPANVGLTSTRHIFPPDYRPCCGDRLFGIETFDLVPVKPPRQK